MQTRQTMNFAPRSRLAGKRPTTCADMDTAALHDERFRAKIRPLLMANRWIDVMKPLHETER
jgi:hypothetical protein